jgi:hypothetical protein
VELLLEIFGANHIQKSLAFITSTGTVRQNAAIKEEVQTACKQKTRTTSKRTKKDFPPSSVPPLPPTHYY